MQPENYLVIDFEATCCDVGTIARENMEIIEFGVVMVEAEGFQDYDLKQLRQDCEFNKVPYPISAPHINVKRQMADIQKLSKKPGLGEAVRLAGIEFIGTPHRGIDDARNIAKLLPYVFGKARLPDQAFGTSAFSKKP